MLHFSRSPALKREFPCFTRASEPEHNRRSLIAPRKYTLASQETVSPGQSAVNYIKTNRIYSREIAADS